MIQTILTALVSLALGYWLGRRARRRRGVRYDWRQDQRLTRDW